MASVNCEVLGEEPSRLRKREWGMYTWHNPKCDHWRERGHPESLRLETHCLLGHHPWRGMSASNYKELVLDALLACCQHHFWGSVVLPTFLWFFCLSLYGEHGMILSSDKYLQWQEEQQVYLARTGYWNGWKSINSLWWKMTEDNSPFK